MVRSEMVVRRSVNQLFTRLQVFQDVGRDLYLMGQAGGPCPPGAAAPNPRQFQTSAITLLFPAGEVSSSDSEGRRLTSVDGPQRCVGVGVIYAFADIR